ncbi:MAG TPA: glycosyltransferase family 39 protein, partial [Acidobacteriota bacterium]|nr:glycosyltransferase family 39 protein [Acidobacteriota bacterium]
MYPRRAMFIQFDQRFGKWLLFLGLAFLYFYGSNILPLLGPDEPRYTQVARQMFESGDWVTPRLGEHPWFEKPILLYWMMSVSFVIFGVNEFAARFPSALSALVCVLILYHFLKHHLGGKRALLAGIIFGTSAFVVGFAHAATFDMLLTTCVSASLFYFFQYLAVAREKKNIFAAYAFCGLGILAKGFVAPAIIFLAGAIFWFFERKTKPKLYLITGALIVAGVAGIWLVP